MPSSTAMSCRLACFLLLMLVPCTATRAQQDEPDGDVITLTSGAQMTGVQVIRKTATNFQVQIVEGVVMEIPVNLVAHVEYDDYEPLHGRRGGRAPGGNGQEDEIRAQEMAPALNKVLTQPLESPLSFPPLDLFVILEEVAHRFGFEVEIDENLHDIPPEHRLWEVMVPEGAGLLRLFRDELPARFPLLVAVPQFDRVVVTSRAAAEERGLIESAEYNNHASPPGAPSSAAPGSVRAEAPIE